MTHPSDRTTVYADRASVAETLTHVEVAERLAPGTLVAGRYRIISFRGLGGMGIVYKARDEELGVDVALKVLRSDLGRDPRWVQRFRRELLLARQVTHRNVVRIHDIGESGPLRFLTMDFVDGPSLAEVLGTEGLLRVQRAVGIIRQLADALQQAHAAGIVHRDLKPSNILLGSDETAYITDFGVARSRDGEALTRAGAIVGTPDYLSPEQLSGQPVDGRSDLYALGIVFYEILTGQLPFRGETQSETLAQRLAGEAPDVSSVGVRVPAGVQRVLRRCLTRVPTRRYQQAREIVADLDAVERTSNGWRQGSRFTPARLPRWGPRRWAIAVCATLLVAALVWWGAGMLDGDTPADGEAPALRTRAPTAAAAYLEGQARLHEGDPSAAASLFQRAVEIDAHFAEALEGLSHAYHDLGDLDAAVEAAERAEALVGHDEHGLADRVRARLAMLRQEPADALPLYTRLAARYPNDTSTLIDLASALAAAGRPAHAIQTLNRVTRIDPTNARAWLSLGESTLRFGSPRAAVDGHLARARSLYERVDDKQGMASVAEAMGEADYQTGEYEQALAHYTEAISRRERLGDQRALATTFRQRAEAQLANGDRRLAAADIASARLVLQRQGDRAAIASFIDATGAMYDTQGAHGLAQQAYQEALLMKRSLGDTARLAQSYDRVGDAALAQGDYASAPLYWNEALVLRQRAGDKRGVIASTQDLGSLAFVSGRWSEAGETFRTTLQRSRVMSFRRGMAVSHENLARLHRYRGRYGDALSSLQEALAIARQLDEPGLLIDCTLDEAALLIELGQLDGARARLAAAEDSIQMAHNRDQQTRHHLLVALLHERDGHHTAADRALDETGEAAAAGDNHALSLRVRLAQARMRSERGEAEARAALSKLATEADSLGNAVLRLEAGAAVAGAELRAGRAVRAERRARRTIELAERVGWGAGRYLLHSLLGEALKARGAQAAAAREQATAQVALTEMRDGLAPQLREGFDTFHEARD